MSELAGLQEITDRVDRILRGEAIIAAGVPAGAVPSWYGSELPFDAWMRMWRLVAPTAAGDEAHYQAGAIGWASRP